jgi:hypothetical protein
VRKPKDGCFRRRSNDEGPIYLPPARGDGDKLDDQPSTLPLRPTLS